MNQQYRGYTPPHTYVVGSDASTAFMRKVFMFMTLGLIATAATSLVVSSSPALTAAIVQPSVLYPLMFLELGMVFGFTFLANRISAAAAAALFFSYAIVNGLTLSVIFLIYTHSSIALTFFVTGGTFGAMSAYGYLTKRDLTAIGSFMMMGLFGLIIASIANIFLHSAMITWITSCLGVLIFTGLTAYDTQKIKQIGLAGGAGQESKLALQGALILYLDFINLFLYLLRFFGRRRD